MITFFRKIRQSLISQNKVKRYILYALGEIILVVIGILIAVQINELNQKRKQNAAQRTNATIIIENLRKDSLYLVNWQAFTLVDQKALDLLQPRLIAPDVTIDTLIKISTKEYPGRINIIEFDNQVAFNTMVSTGEINFFDNELIEEIYSYYAQQEKAEDRSNYSFDLYLNTMNAYKAKYLGNENGVYKGPLNDQVWQNIDEAHFIASFNNRFTTKRIFYNQVQGIMDDVQAQVNSLLSKLRQLKD